MDRVDTDKGYAIVELSQPACRRPHSTVVCQVLDIESVLKGKMETGTCSFSMLGIGIFMSFITGNGIF